MKMAGALLIISVCTGIGLLMAQRSKNVYRLLEEICSALEILKSEIGFSGTDLASAFKRVDKMTDTEGIFGRAAMKIEDNGISRAWQESVDESSLSAENKSMLKLLCTKLGKTDTQGQLRHIEYVEGLIKGRAEKARAVYEKNGRIYRGAGFLVGAAAVLLLI